MRADTLLCELTDLAVAQQRSDSPARRARSVEAFELAGRLRVAALWDEKTDALIAGALRLVKLLELTPSWLRPPDELDDETFLKAVTSSDSIKQVAAKIHRHPRTVARRLKTLMRHSVADVTWTRAASLRRSKVMKGKNMMTAK
jgi:hypothetical protein